MVIVYHLLRPFRLLLQCFRSRKQLQSHETPCSFTDAPRRPSISGHISQIKDDQHDINPRYLPLPQKGSFGDTSDRHPPSELSSLLEIGDPYPATTSTLDELQAALSNAKVPHLTNGHVFFVPLSKLDKLITEARVQDILSEAHMMEDDLIQETAQRIVHSAKKLFAILVSMKKGNQACTFLDEGITDADLPFDIKPRAESEPLLLQTRKGLDIVSTHDWSEFDVERLMRRKWRILAPVFEQGMHYEFPKLQILPFMTPVNSDEEYIAGGWSVVYQASIHPAHDRLRSPRGCQDRETVVAIKKLILPNPSYFEAERDIHTTLEQTAGPHSHLTNLLFTYKHGNEYHLVFPWADFNLREYWETKPSMQLDVREIFWSLRQMAGIAGALSLIHGFLRSNDSVADPLFGHHGDIKAENILYFASRSGNKDSDGILRITDLGLASINRMGSASDIDPAKVSGTQTYSPPDKLRSARISRKWDIWSLGCLFLEFATSLAAGYEALREFGHLRFQEGSHPDLPELCSDYFYTVNYEDVRPSVREWAVHLTDELRCSDMLYDLLCLVMQKMIRINPEDRATSQQIHQDLSAMIKKASKDESYLIKATDRPPIWL